MPDRNLSREELAAVTFANDQEWCSAEDNLELLENVLNIVCQEPRVFQQTLIRDTIALDKPGGVQVALQKCCAMVVGRIYILQAERKRESLEDES